MGIATTHHGLESRRLLTLLLACLLLVVRADAGGGDDALDSTDLVRFLRAGVSERTMLAELHARGFREPLDASREATLREAGATETLIIAVRGVAPVQSLPGPGRDPAGRGHGGWGGGGGHGGWGGGGQRAPGAFGSGAGAGRGRGSTAGRCASSRTTREGGRPS